MFWWRCSRCDKLLKRDDMRIDTVESSTEIRKIYYCIDCYHEKWLSDWKAERQEMAREAK